MIPSVTFGTRSDNLRRALVFPAMLLALSCGVSALVPLYESRRPRHALMEKPWRVAVSGAGGQTGQSVFRKMLARPSEFALLGLVRSEASREALIASGVPAEAVAVTDVTDAEAVKACVKACDALVICTSAKPSPSGETDETTDRPIFGFPDGDPELVDWLGQKNQIDAMPSDAQVLICSSMGGTDPANMLNALGR